MKSFLTKDEVLRAQEVLAEKDLSKLIDHLDKTLREKLGASPLWEKCRPIALGSWARGELCAKSDIDLIFLGEEKDVREFLSQPLATGLKIRSRVPADRNDWTVGVLPFDVLALFSARPFFTRDQVLIDEQLSLIRSRGAAYQKFLLKAMVKERNERNLRYDSIANYLEPNIKYGPGGLRDLDQGLMIYELYGKERFSDYQTNVERLKQLKNQLLHIREWLHLNGSGDILSSHAQHDLTQFFGYKSTQDFMSKVQYRLSEVNFYADWFVDFVQKNPRRISAIKSTKVTGYSEAFKALQSDRSPTMQEHVRKTRKKFISSAQKGLSVKKFLNLDMDDEYLQAVFRAKLLEDIFPHLRRLRGYVQHDQYHRYSVDAHTMQTIREVMRLKKKPKRLGKLAGLVRALTAAQWEILFWSALYHDLGKGLKLDHSQEGRRIVFDELKAFGFSQAVTEEVGWMVQNHLIVSTAAFRQNPKSSATWTELFNRGVLGQRIPLLTLFTAIDIRATNPEAWNEWKERLLFDLATSLQSPEAGQVKNVLKVSKQLRLKIDKEFLDEIDPYLLEGVSHNVLLKDMKRALTNSKSLSPLVVKNRKREIWVRFHSAQDQPGLFLAYTSLLNSFGLSVQQAYATTHPKWGVYDWFKIRTTKPIALIRKHLTTVGLVSGDRSVVSSGGTLDQQILSDFDVVELVTKDSGKAVLSFRGKDRRGALQAAATAIYNSGLDIVSAKVHTWGQQIDDVFTVRFDEQALQKLLAKDT